MVDNATDAPPPAPDVADFEGDGVDRRDAVEYDAETETYRASFDASTESAPLAVVATVAVLEETTPAELPPLYAAVDPEALEAVVESADAASSAPVHASFSFEGYAVTVHGDGVVTVAPEERFERPSP